MQLVISKKGAALSINNGRFIIRTPDQQHYVAVHQVKSICIHPATKLTHEVVTTALENNIDVLFFDRKGFPVARIWGHQFGSIATIRKNQLAFAVSVESIDWIRSILVRKTENQHAMVSLLASLTTVDYNKHDVEERLQKFRHYIREFKYYKGVDKQDTFASFRGFEGVIGKIYFSTISALLPEKYRFTKRSQNPGLDPFNGLLNYAYGMLYGYIESALIKAGLDPFIGIMHRDEYNRPVLTYDFIEAYRQWADYVVCHLCLQEVVEDNYFEIKPITPHSSRYWLSQTGKRILIQTMNDYLHEVVEVDGMSRSRLVHMEMDAKSLANRIKKMNIQ